MRFNDLGLDIIELGVKNKLDVVKLIIDVLNFKPNEVIYLGDDVMDLECIKYCYGVCPADAHICIKESANFVLETNGGLGVLLELENKFFNDGI